MVEETERGGVTNGESRIGEVAKLPIPFSSVFFTPLFLFGYFTAITPVPTAPCHQLNNTALHFSISTYIKTHGFHRHVRKIVGVNAKAPILRWATTTPPTLLHSHSDKKLSYR